MSAERTPLLLEGRPESPDLASRLATSADLSSEARDDAAHQAVPTLRLVEDEPLPLLNIDQLVVVQLMCEFARLNGEVRALRKRVAYLEGATPV